jgi:hypothetical protein
MPGPSFFLRLLQHDLGDLMITVTFLGRFAVQSCCLVSFDNGVGHDVAQFTLATFPSSWFRADIGMPGKAHLGGRAFRVTSPVAGAEMSSSLFDATMSAWKPAGCARTAAPLSPPVTKSARTAI